ncbi:hypothetical protein [Bacillus massilinigeriensis]|uniref:hypothetical protein n=1 Tax=Bacillus massilionigeriensis TaxID=1805475 RepID=UPI00096B6054|nr:hypothetical protein [Bacillus massilionigeriensis]
MRVLFENPIILIIILGIISSLFKKGKEPEKKGSNQKQSRRRQNIPKPLQKSMQELKEVVQTEISTQKKVKTPKKTYIDDLAKYDEVKEESISKINDYKEQMEKIERKTELIKKKAEKNQLSPSQQPLDENKIIDAIVWSEILGPPRAKNRHRVYQGSRYIRNR